MYKEVLRLPVGKSVETGNTLPRVVRKEKRKKRRKKEETKDTVSRKPPGQLCMTGPVSTGSGHRSSSAQSSIHKVKLSEGDKGKKTASEEEGPVTMKIVQ